MGKSWFFEYQTHLKIDGDKISLVYPDGHIKEFKKIDSVWQNQTDEDQSDTLMEDSKGFIFITGKNLVYRYDEKGRLASISDPNGNTVSLEYNKNGEIDAVISPGGKILTFRYKDGKICQIADNIGRKVLYSYNGDNLAKVTLPNGGTVRHTCENDRIVKVTDQNGIIYVTNEYDEKGRVTKQYDSEGNLTKIEYDDEKWENTFTYCATGVVEKYRYNERTLVTQNEIVNDKAALEKFLKKGG